MPINSQDILSARARKDGLSPAWDMTNLDFLRIAEEVAEMNRIGATYLSSPDPDVSKYWRVLKMVYYDLKPMMWAGNAEKGKMSQDGKKKLRVGGRAFFEKFKTAIETLVELFYVNKTREPYPDIILIKALDLFHEQLLEEKQRCGLGIKTKRRRKLYDGFDTDAKVEL